MSKQDNAILDTTMTTWDEVHEVLLGLFYPCDKLCCDFQGQRPESLRASKYKISFGTCLFTLFLLTQFSYSENIMLLRPSKEAADQDQKERGIESNDYLETIDHDLYHDGEEASTEHEH
jgi:hypothetical protein